MDIQPLEIVDAQPSSLSALGVRRFVLGPNDVAEAAEALARVFSTQEPLTQALSVSAAAFAPLAEAVCEAAAETGLSVIARNREQRLVGFRISEPWPAPAGEAPPLSPGLEHIFCLLRHLEETFDRLHAADNRAVHFQMMGCMPGYEGQGLATTLVRDSLEIARRRGFPRVFVEATHEGSARVFRRLEFKTLLEVPYATFEVEGRRVFEGLGTGSCLLMEKELLAPAAQGG